MKYFFLIQVLIISMSMAPAFAATETQPLPATDTLQNSQDSATSSENVANLPAQDTNATASSSEAAPASDLTVPQDASAVMPGTAPKSSESATTAMASIPADVQSLIQNGDLLKAREELLKLWKETPDTSSKDEIETALSDVNSKLLTSKEKFPGIVVYQVKTGDSLYVIAKKNKTSVRMIEKVNGLQTDVIRVGQKLNILQGNFSITVDKSDNVLRLFLGDEFFKRYTVATGATDDLTPVGTFTIATKLENPTWYKTGVKAIPPGTPKNLLGSRWLGFTKPGYGIHGTTIPESIGKHATSGCIRMHNEQVEELYDLVPAGTKVSIVE